MEYAIKTIRYLKKTNWVFVGALLALLTFPFVGAASMLPAEQLKTLTVDTSFLSMETPPIGCFYPCNNPYKRKDGTQYCGDSNWR